MPPDSQSSPDPTRFTRALNECAPSELPPDVEAELQCELRHLAEMHMAREGSAHTLQSTALLNEAYLRLWHSPSGARSFPSRGHFYALASRLMRTILVDHARKKKSKKRGGDWARVTLAVGHPTEAPGLSPCEIKADLMDLSDALEQLAAMRAELAEVVEMRFFGGLDVDAIGEAVGVSGRTVERRLRAATAWLLERLGGGTQP